MSAIDQPSTLIDTFPETVGPSDFRVDVLQSARVVRIMTFKRGEVELERDVC